MVRVAINVLRNRISGTFTATKHNIIPEQGGN